MSFRMKHVVLCAALAAFLAAPALAQTAQERATTVEFTTVTRLPGVTLQPGKYVFRLGEPVTTQNVVEVYSEDGTTRLATLLTVDYATPLSGTVTTVMFDNTDPPALRAWYFPGETIGREFVYTEQEANTIFVTANTPVLVAAWDPDDRTVVGRVEVKTVGQAIGAAARATAGVVKDVARGVADVTEDIWDDITDNMKLVNPTESRKAAERHLDMAERVYDELEDRLTDEQEAPLKPMRRHLEKLEDAFEKDEPWMAHYTAVMAELDRLVPEGPVGTSGAVRLDASTTAALVSIRGHLKAFHAQAMK
jgi:hypothetical protein